MTDTTKPLNTPGAAATSTPDAGLTSAAIAAPRIAITYCTQCLWLLRAAWMGQELLSTFSTELREVALVPGTGGIFQIHYDDTLIWDRKADGGFPEAKVLKQRVRDRLDPGRDMGHVDRT
jgi:selenoprotein W-related protein